jgi:hypothetical protein
MRGALLSVFVCVAVVACGGSSSSSGFPDGGGGGSSGGGGGSSGGGSGGSGSSGSSGGSILGDGGVGSPDAGNGCSSEAADYVYVLSAENSLYKFAPLQKTFTLIGPLQCQTSMQPNSMAVDRNADAYVNYMDDSTGAVTSGVIYKVSTADASCSAQPLMAMPSGWAQVGMGYSTVNTGSNVETLYVASIATGDLGLVDFGQNNVGPIGPFTGMVAGQGAELTGTGDGRLFGYFTTTPVYVAQIDKMNGSTPNPVPMTGVQTPLDWAFSFWGGHFYLYSSQGNGSSVTDYDPTTGTINTSYITQVGFDIVGAGVSTCAPQ